MRVCSFSLCYYNIWDNVKKDGTKVDAYICEGCGKANYHSEFCQKLDKKHQRICPGALKTAQGLDEEKAAKVIPGKGEPKMVKKQGTAVLQAAFPQVALENKENISPSFFNASLKHVGKASAQSPPSWIGLKAAPQSSASYTPLFPDSLVTAKKRGDVLFLSNYEVYCNKVLGEGSYGKVLLGREILTALEVAVKVVSKQSATFAQQAVLLQREVAVQRRLRHQNILGLKDVFEDAQHVYLVLEHCGGGSLFDYVQKKGGLSERETFIYFLQVCLAIETLHKNRMVHRDIKPENLLLDKGKNLKLCDFGCSFMFLPNTPKLRKTYCGTVDYMAPEFFLKNPHGPEADIWALGVLLFEMCHGRPPFDQEDESRKIEAITMPGLSGQDSDRHFVSGQSDARIGEYSFGYKSGVSSEFRDLVERLIRSEPKDRLSVQEIFTHPWVQIHSEKLNIDLDRFRGRIDNSPVPEQARVHAAGMGKQLTQRSSQQGDTELGCFSRCELRPTEVVLYGDESYLNELKQENEREKHQESTRQQRRSTCGPHLGLDRSGLLVAQYSYRDSETDSSPDSPGSPHQLLAMLKDSHPDTSQEQANLAPDTESIKVVAKKKGKNSLDVFKKKADPIEEDCNPSEAGRGLPMKVHERSPTECKIKTKAIWEGNRPTTKDCGQSPISKRMTAQNLEMVVLGNILMIEEAPKPDCSDTELETRVGGELTSASPNLACSKPADVLASSWMGSQIPITKRTSPETPTLKVPSRSRSEISRRDKDSTRSSFAQGEKRDKSLQGGCKTSSRNSQVQIAIRSQQQSSTVVDSHGNLQGGFFGGFLNIFGCTSVK